MMINPLEKIFRKKDPTEKYEHWTTLTINGKDYHLGGWEDIHHSYYRCNELDHSEFGKDSKEARTKLEKWIVRTVLFKE